MQARSNMDYSAIKGNDGLCRFLLVMGFVVSAVLMMAASRGDLSPDEIVSLETALTPQNWLAVVTQNANDNNHLLNTFLLRLLGWQQNLFVYRIPAVLFGIYTIAALAWTARRWSGETAV